MIRWLYDVTIGRLIDSHIRRQLLFRRLILGDPTRVSIAESATLNKALLNTLSGRIIIAEHVFCSHNVCLLTGTHEVDAPMHLRGTAIPTEGQDFTIGLGARLASNTTILGQRRIREIAVSGSRHLGHRRRTPTCDCRRSTCSSDWFRTEVGRFSS